MQYLVKIEAVEPRFVECEVGAEDPSEAEKEALLWLERVHPELAEPVVQTIMEV